MRILRRHIIPLLILAGLLVSNDASYAKGKLDSLINTFVLKQANNHYEKLAYKKAIRLYDKLVEDDFTSSPIYRKLADAYYKTGDGARAEMYYEILTQKKDAHADDYYHYAEVLRYNGKYEEADDWMEKYAVIRKEDSRAQKKIDASEKVEDLKEKGEYKIRNCSFNSSYSDFGPAQRGNRLYFTSARKDEAIIRYEHAWNEEPYLDIYWVNVKRKNATPKYLKGKINTAFHDGPAVLSKDSTEIFFTRNNSKFGLPKRGNDNRDNLLLYVGKIVEGEMQEPVALTFNSENYSCGHPALSPDQNTLYFTSDMPGGFGGTDLYYATRSESGWSEPVNMGKTINTEGNEMFPFHHESGRFYFASNGHLGLGGLDIFVAQQVDENEYEIKNMGHPVNSSKDDFSIYLEDDGSFGYFASNREGGQGSDDIYSIEVLNQVEFTLFLQGNVVDAKTGERIQFSRILLRDEENNPIRLMASSDEYDFRVGIDPDQTYTIKAVKEGYLPFEAKIEPKKMEKTGGALNYTIQLNQTPEWGIYGKVYEKETGEALSGVKINIENIKTNTTETFTSEPNGSFRIKLEKDTYYKILFEKEGMFAIRTAYSTLGKAAAWVDASEFVDLGFEEIAVNKVIEIPNIYYDLGKWDIRPDAAEELDKVVQFLKDNPNVEIELGSHTDARGNAQSNQELSQKRAQAAVDYIVNKGIDSNRITAKGYGESNIKNRCVDGVQCSEEEHQVNRRTEIRITGI